MIFFSSKTHISTPFEQEMYGLLFINMNIFYDVMGPKIWIKTNIGDIIQGAEYKVKRVSNNEWCKCSAKAAVGRCYSKKVSGLQLY